MCWVCFYPEACHPTTLIRILGHTHSYDNKMSCRITSEKDRRAEHVYVSHMLRKKKKDCNRFDSTEFIYSIKKFQLQDGQSTEYEV